MSLIVPTTFVLAALAADPGAGSEEARRLSARFRGSVLSGNWAWIQDIQDEDAFYGTLSQVRTGFRRWILASKNLDDLLARLQPMWAWYL